MHTDRKIGFAMGILLIGIVAALFFRNEPLLNPEVPTVRREQEINDRLRERNVAVYLTDEDEPANGDSAKEQDQQRWTLKEVLDNMGARNKSRPSPVGAQPDSAATIEVSKSSAASPDDASPIPTGGVKTAGAKSTGAKTIDVDDVPVPVDSKSSLVVMADEADDESATDVLIVEPSADTSKENIFQPPADFEEYVVKYGDTLSGIAQKFLGSQSRYQEIYEANRDRMSSPDRLDVGKPLRIPHVASNVDPSGTH